MEACCAACSSASVRSQCGTVCSGAPACTACKASAGDSKQPHSWRSVFAPSGADVGTWLQRSSCQSQSGSPAYRSRASSSASRVMQCGGISRAWARPWLTRACSRSGVCQAGGISPSTWGAAVKAMSTSASSSQAAGIRPMVLGSCSTANRQASRVAGGVWAGVVSAAQGTSGLVAAMGRRASRACCAACSASTLGATISHSSHQASPSPVSACG